MARSTSKATLKVVKGDLPAAAFGAKPSRSTLHQVVVRQGANARAGTQKTKGRSDMRGGGAKPWRQKGSGRARAGSRRSPLWRGGAHIHNISPRSYDFEMPRKMRRVALKSLLAELAAAGGVTIVEKIEIPEPKSRLVESLLDDLQVASAVFVTDEPSRNLVLGARNLPEVKVLTLATLNPIDLIQHEKVVIEKGVLGKLEALLGQE